MRTAVACLVFIAFIWMKGNFEEIQDNKIRGVSSDPDLVNQTLIAGFSFVLLLVFLLVLVSVKIINHNKKDKNEGGYDRRKKR